MSFFLGLADLAAKLNWGLELASSANSMHNF